MSALILTIELMPKGAWGRDLSKTLPKKDWDKLRKYCYEKANYCCEICGAKDDNLHAHEEWDFDLKEKTQTLKNIVALCSACHGVKHFRNSERIGYGENARKHFMRVNKCSELVFAGHLAQAEMLFEKRNDILRWKMKVDLQSFGGKDIDYVQDKYPLINNPYNDINWDNIKYKFSGEMEDINLPYIEEHAMQKIYIYSADKQNVNYEKEKIYYLIQYGNLLPPKLDAIKVDNYLGVITITADRVNKINWYLNNKLCKTNYNISGRMRNEFSVKNIEEGRLRFCLIGKGGLVISQEFNLNQEN